VTFLGELEFLAQSNANVLLRFAQVTFLVTHFSDSRIANSDVRDILLQSTTGSGFRSRTSCCGCARVLGSERRNVCHMGSRSPRISRWVKWSCVESCVL
jgi:hypothetical protein